MLPDQFPILRGKTIESLSVTFYNYNKIASILVHCTDQKLYLIDCEKGTCQQTFTLHH